MTAAFTAMRGNQDSSHDMHVDRQALIECVFKDYITKS